MAATGFEGFEKRLELRFSGESTPGLRSLDIQSIKEILDAAQCTIVSGIGNRHFDAYVLSESSLFVYPKNIIIKTCGTTQLLKAIPTLLAHTPKLGLNVMACRYTRGSFIFPKMQTYPHTSFDEEISYLKQSLPSNLCDIRSSVMCTDTSHSWHVFTASDPSVAQAGSTYTIEMCMTGLDPCRAGKFYRRESGTASGDAVGKEMTFETGIGGVHPSAVFCDYAFDPCGYSMNSMEGPRYSTVHVTPEDGYSYASFECVGQEAEGGDVRLEEELEKVVEVFRPAALSVAVTGTNGESQVWMRIAAAMEAVGLKRLSCRKMDFPADGVVVFQAFEALSR